jgi:cephalosporin hydroxylase
MSVEQDPITQFRAEVRERVDVYPQDDAWQGLSRDWMIKAFAQKYMYNFNWLGRPIIQLPADMVAFQEVVWAVKPDLIIETGIAHGGSLILSASMLAMLDVADALASGQAYDPAQSRRRVLGVDIDIREHNRRAIEEHPFSAYIDMLQGSSISEEMEARVHDYAKPYQRVLVCLDSNHTHDHVLAELRAYAPLVSKGSYCLAFDTIIETMPADTFPDRPWTPGDNARTAVWAYLKELEGGQSLAADGDPLTLAVDKSIEDKLLLSVAPDGFLKRSES